MADLVTRAIITGHDRLTGPFGAMASKVNAINGRLMKGTQRLGAASSSLGISALGGAIGFTYLIDKAEQFNKAIFGVGAASLPELAPKDGKTAVDLALDDMKQIEEASFRLSRELGVSTTAISQVGETLKKAGLPTDQLNEVMRVTTSLSKTDLETPANTMADFLHTLTVIQKQRPGEEFGAFIKRQADMVYTAAATTKLSVGSMMDGMRQFQTIGAGMGMETEEMLALLMGGAQRGFNPIELGTALKSDMVRAIKPTAEGQAAINQILGKQGKNLSNYASLEAIDPTRAAGNLLRAQGLTGEKGLRGKLVKQLRAAQEGGYTMSDGNVDDITRLIAKKRGVNDAEGIQGIRNSVVSAIGSPTGSFDFVPLMRDLIKGGMTDAQLASIFEGRQLARNKAFIDTIRDGDYDQFVQTLQRMNGQGLDDVNTLWSKSAIGNVTAMKAAFERLSIVLANSQGIQSFVNWIERGADAASRMNPAMMDLGMRALLFGALASPLVNTARGLFSIGAAGVMAAKGFGKMASTPFSKLSKGLDALGVANFAKGRVQGSALARNLAPVARVMGTIARFAGPLALVGGAFALFSNWDSVVAGFQQLAGSESVKTAGEAIERLSNALAPVGTFLADTYTSLLNLLGVDTTGSLLLKGLDNMIWAFGKVTDGIARAIEKFNEWTGLTATKADGGSTAGDKKLVNGWDGSGPVNRATAMGRAGMGEWEPPKINLEVPEQKPPGWLDTIPGQIIGAIKSGFAGIVLNPTVNVTGGGSSTGAMSPAPRTQNGGQHNGGN
jgi:hypothetical protein